MARIVEQPISKVKYIKKNMRRAEHTRGGTQMVCMEFTSRPRYQRLVIDFEHGEDPDDAYSRVPYEKGSNLLFHLGEIVPAGMVDTR